MAFQPPQAPDDVLQKLQEARSSTPTYLYKVYIVDLPIDAPTKADAIANSNANGKNKSQSKANAKPGPKADADSKSKANPTTTINPNPSPTVQPLSLTFGAPVTSTLTHPIPQTIDSLRLFLRTQPHRADEVSWCGHDKDEFSMWTSSLLSALQLAKYKEGLLGKARWEGRLKVENKNEVKKELTSEVRICVVDSRKIERQGVEVYGAGKLVDVYLRENPKRMAAKSKEQLEAENAAANWQQELKKMVDEGKHVKPVKGKPEEKKSKPRPPPKDNTQHYVAEYLVHGRLDLKDCSSTVALSTLESNDLYKLMPELENAGGFFLTSKSAPTTPPPPALEKDEKTKRWMPSPLPVEKLGQGGESLATRVQKLREQIFVRPMAVSQENTTAVAKIASCFGEQLVLPMALAIIALRYRKQDDPEILKLARKLAGGTSSLTQTLSVDDDVLEVVMFKKLVDSVCDELGEGGEIGHRVAAPAT